MAITKVDVRNWLYKCQNKATGAVTKKCMDEVMKLAVNNPSLSSLIKSLDSMDAATRKLIKELTLLGMQNASMSTNITGFSYPGPYFYVDVQSSASIVVNAVLSAPTKFPKEAEVAKAAIKEREEVGSEYRNLVNRCEAMKPAQAVEYLSELGFDTSTIRPASKPVNKAKLFVCNSDKP